MSSESVPPDLLALERDRWHYQVLNPLTVISARTQLLQRIAEQTPGLNDLERTALLHGLVVILASARQLRSSLEVATGPDVLSTTRPPEEPA